MYGFDLPVIYFVYIIECEDGTLYTGITTDSSRRFKEHMSGKAARYTRSHRPKLLVYEEQVLTQSCALKREHAIKKMTRAQKIRMIQCSPRRD